MKDEMENSAFHIPARPLSQLRASPESRRRDFYSPESRRRDFFSKQRLIIRVCVCIRRSREK